MHIRPHPASLLATLLTVILAAVPAWGQPAPMIPGPPKVLEKVGIDQNLNAQVPADIVFRDDAGLQVRLGDYFGKKPIVLSLVYYECPMLCGIALNGMTKAFKPMNLSVGPDYTVVAVSFDPRETPELAAAKKANYVKSYGRNGAAEGWHFLTGDTESIRRLTEAVGFHYTWDQATQQYAHTIALIVLTPDGRISRYLYGVDYAPRDLRLALVEASQHRIGTLADKVLLLCYHYDPLTGRYGFAITTALRVGAVLTLALLAGFVTYRLRRDKATDTRTTTAGS